MKPVNNMQVTSYEASFIIAHQKGNVESTVVPVAIRVGFRHKRTGYGYCPYDDCGVLDLFDTLTILDQRWGWGPSQRAQPSTLVGSCDQPLTAPGKFASLRSKFGFNKMK
jgi:hypothetical protein